MGKDKTFYVDVTVRWTQALGAESQKEALERTADLFEEEYGFRPANHEMKITSEKRGFKVKVAFGALSGECIDGSMSKKEFVDGGGQVKVKTFKTAAERKAYIQGLEDADGWTETAHEEVK